MNRAIRSARWAAYVLAVCLAVLLVVGPQRYRSDIYAWLPSGEVFRVSPDDSGTYYQACISPDGSNVIFGGAHTGPPRIWRAELPGGQVRPLTPADTAAFLASYDWDGSSIVFSSDRSFDVPSVRVEDIPDPRIYRPATRGDRYRNFNLFVMAADGARVRQLTTGAFRDLRGTFTPDGTRVTFYANRKPFAPFWTTLADGSGEPHRIPLEGQRVWNAYRPWYSADASKLFFFGTNREDRERVRLHWVAAQGGTPEVFGFDDRGKTQAPFVDSTSGALLFHNDRSGRSELFELPLGAEQPRKLVPPGLDLPPGAEVMHPTRSRNGIITFDLSSFAGSAPLVALRSARAWLKAGIDWRWNELVGRRDVSE